MGPEEAVRGTRAYAYEGSRPDVRARVPSCARRVLDLGCASGALGAALKASSNTEVVGIEVDRDYAHTAEERLDRVECFDLNDFPDAGALHDSLGRFDCIVCADVLEHVTQPGAVLASAVRLLNPGGTVVVSVPNVRHWSVLRAVFLQGTWPQQDVGIFDRTHLRWFTVGDALALVRGAGLSVADVQLSYWEPRRLRLLFELVDQTPLREVLAYQTMVVARHRRAVEATHAARATVGA